MSNIEASNIECNLDSMIEQAKTPETNDTQNRSLYTPPSLICYGTINDLTLTGNVGPDDATLSSVEGG